jgi:hypothetical protein
LEKFVAAGGAAATLDVIALKVTLVDCKSFCGDVSFVLGSFGSRSKDEGRHSN